jgi:hypothetical protein
MAASPTKGQGLKMPARMSTCVRNGIYEWILPLARLSCEDAINIDMTFKSKTSGRRYVRRASPHLAMWLVV